MSDFIQSLSAFSVFLAITAFGFLFLLISLVFGELFDHFEMGHDSGLDHDVDGGPGFFSPRVVAVFVTAFGATGAIGIYYGLSTAASSGVGFVSGLVFGYVIYSFARFLYSQQASTQVRSQDVIGQTARVVVSIPKDGVGQVRCRIGDELVDRIARTRSGEAVPENSAVLVEEVLGEIVIVKKT